MTRPDDVPGDVWEKAFYWLDDSGLMSVLETEDEESFMRSVSRAILTARAEQREEDAKIVAERRKLYAEGAFGDPRLALREAENSIREAAIRNGGR